MNFSVFLADPSETYFYQDTWSEKRKSNVITSMRQAEMSVKAVSVNFSFAFSVAGDLTNVAMEGI